MRVPVPEGAFVEGDRISLAGTNDHHYGAADVNLDDVRHARTVRVERDGEGLHVSVNAHHAAAVARHLTGEFDAGLDPAEYEPDAGVVGDDEADGEDEDEAGGEGTDADGEAAPDVEAALDDHWRTVVDDVESGVYDGVLDALDAADDRDSVQSAIEERRGALEE